MLVASSTWLMVFTYASYPALGGLGVILLAYGVTYGLTWRARLPAVWHSQARVIAGDIEAEGARRRDRGDDDPGAGPSCTDGPALGLQGWIKEHFAGVDRWLVATVQKLLDDEQLDGRDAAELVVRPGRSHWRLLLGLVAVAAPPAGLWPTCCGCMIWINDITAALKAGETITFEGVDIALVTTAFGCVLSVAAIVMMTAVQIRFSSYAAALAEAAQRVVAAYRGQQKGDRDDA